MISNNKITYAPLDILRGTYSHLNFKRKKELATVLVLSIFSALAESISIAMLIPFVNFFINPETYVLNSFFENIISLFNLKDKSEILAIIIFIFILIVLCSSFIRLKYNKLSNLLAEDITSDFRIKIFSFLINQDYNYFKKHGSNELMSNFTLKTKTVMSLIFSTINMLNSFLISIAIITILIYNEPFYTPIIITFITLFFFIIYKIKSISALGLGEKINKNQNRIVDVFENSVGLLPEIIVYNLKNFYLSILSKSSKIVAHSLAEARTIGAAPRIYLETFVIFFVLLFIYFLNFTDRKIETNISYLAILAFGAQKCLPYINNIYLNSISFRASTPAIYAFINLLNKDKNQIINDTDFDRLNFNNNLKIDNLSYQYDTQLPYVLKNINLEIIKGEKIAIKGDTGSGKSTLINILSGLLTPTEGGIQIDGVKIDKNNIKNWQKNISLVPQVVFLNNTTILENIAIAENFSKIDVERVKKCATLANINNFIEKLPNKYNEKVGERGTRFSGGQVQRIGIARALYRKSDLIIMDEPTNALDKETESLIMQSLIKLDKKITVIMISHSSNYLKYFDKVIDINMFK